jgi:hypothetical protein
MKKRNISQFALGVLNYKVIFPKMMLINCWLSTVLIFLINRMFHHPLFTTLKLERFVLALILFFSVAVWYMYLSPAQTI